MLNPQDFDAWRNQLKSFIPERTPGQARRIFVVTDDSSDLQTVDLNPLFTSHEGMGRLIKETQKQAAALNQYRAGKGLADGLSNLISSKSELDSTAAAR